MSQLSARPGSSFVPPRPNSIRRLYTEAALAVCAGMVSDWFASNPVGLTSKQYVSVLSGIAAILSDIFMNILMIKTSPMRIKITFYIEMTQEFLDGFLMRIKDLVNFEQCT